MADDLRKADEALERLEQAKRDALQPGATVYWRSWDGVLRGPAVIEAVTEVDGVPWVCLKWDGCIHWVNARLIEDEPPVPPEVTRRSPGRRWPEPDCCELCGDAKCLAWSVPQQKWVCIMCLDPGKG